MSDDDFFAQMQDVKPLKPSNKLEDWHKKQQVSRAVAEARCKVAEGETLSSQQSNGDDASAVLAREFVSDEYLEKVRADDILTYKRAGIQDGVYKKFRLGKYVIEARLDLHRMRVHEARREVATFLSEAMDRDHRTVLILHGKGDRNPDPTQQAVLKSYLNKWLKEFPAVLAFHSAQQQHGGRGAVYVMLKKSEAMKEKTREAHRVGKE